MKSLKDKCLRLLAYRLFTGKLQRPVNSLPKDLRSELGKKTWELGRCVNYIPYNKGIYEPWTIVYGPSRSVPITEHLHDLPIDLTKGKLEAGPHLSMDNTACLTYSFPEDPASHMRRKCFVRPYYSTRIGIQINTSQNKIVLIDFTFHEPEGTTDKWILDIDSVTNGLQLDALLLPRVKRIRAPSLYPERAEV